MACHLHQIWLEIHKKRSNETATDSIMSPVDIQTAMRNMWTHHHQHYTPWQTPDPGSLGWHCRNVERCRWQVNDLSKMKSSTSEPLDPLVHKDGQKKKLKLIAEGNEVQVADPDDPQKPTYLQWQRKIDLEMVAHHITGFKFYPKGEWVSQKEINVYLSHLGQHIIHAPAALRMDYDLARRGDLMIRQEWMRHCKDGKKLGEAIMLSVPMMNIHIHYVTKVTHNAPTAQLSREQIQKLINDRIRNQKGGGKGERGRGSDRSRSPRGGKGGKGNGGKGRGGGGGNGKSSANKAKCDLYNSKEGCNRQHCRFAHVCKKCNKKNCPTPGFCK